ncbi:carboxypeptidase-like regulatory domain-containing protein [Natronorubrum sediminis]|nr:carboxypeptidase-like regulatory domain-containing protein [Natronorubrum sediminis]
MHEDESIPGQILLSDDAIDHIDVVQHAFSWLGEPSSDQCHVHIMLENTSDAELIVDMEARIFDEDGTDLSSTREIGVTGPEPGEDDAVYSFELDNCEETAEYRLDISNLEVTDDSTEEEDSVEETDDSDERAQEDERDGGDEEPDDENEEAEDEDEDVESEDEDESTEQDEADDDDDEQVDGEDDSADEEDENDVVAGTHTLRVTVQDGDGDPIDHAIVGITEGNSDGWSETQNVDNQGQTEFGIEAGEYTLIAEAEGYPTLEREIESDTNVEYTLTLRTND